MKIAKRIAAILLVFLSLGFLGAFLVEIMGPLPFVTKTDRQLFDSYKKVAQEYKIGEVWVDALDKEKYPTRADLVAHLLATNTYTEAQILFLAEDECISSNKLYNDGIIFWRRADSAVFFVRDRHSVFMMARRDFENRYLNQ